MDYILTEDEKLSIVYLVDRRMMGRQWWREFISFSDPTTRDVQKALYATEYALGTYYNIITPSKMLQVTEKMLRAVGVYSLLEKVVMKSVPELSGVDMAYITRQIFPHYFRESEVDFEKKLVQNFYSRVLDGEAQFPKLYFSTIKYPQTAIKRGLWCLEVLLNSQFSSISDMYTAFADGDILTKLKSWKLYNAYKDCGYTFPIEFLHACVKDSLDHTDEDELNYQLLRYKLLVVQWQDNHKKKDDHKEENP